MTQRYGPFASGAGASLGQDDYLDFLGPMLQGDGVNTHVLGGPSLQVYGNSSGLQVLMRAGSALIHGAMYSNNADVNIPITANSSGSPRIDRVVLRMNRSASTVAPFVIAGTPSGSPIPPAITQSFGGSWDLPLAQVAVGAGVAGINPGDVSDERQYLPMKVGYCDSRYGLPPADGSQGRIFYDKNPSVMAFIMTNGSSWTPVLSGDTGWVNLGYTSAWTTDASGAQVRKTGPVIDLRFSAQGSGVGVYNPIVCTLPTGMRPAVTRQFSITVQNTGAVAQDSSIGTAFLIVGTDGNVSIPVAGINLRQPDGSSGRLYTTTRFEASVTFTAG